MKGSIQSIKTRLLNLSKKHNKNHQLTLTRYFQERLLYRLSQSGYKSRFLLKGGVLVYALEQLASRPTLDLDLLARDLSADSSTILAIFQEICQIESVEDGVFFDVASLETEDIVKEGNYPGIRVKVYASLGKIRQRLQIDIGFGDIVIPAPVSMSFPTLLEMDPPEVMAYSIESVISEKFEAMIDLADLNSRMKDFYDVYQILLKHTYELSILEEAVRATFHRRETIRTEEHIIFSEAFHQDENRRKQWNAFLKKSRLNEDLDYSTVMSLISQVLEPIYRKI